ncbi:hypothetical protein R3P38DRAFT_2823900 [Favolaschia claudopus]|uniref:Seipin n=1 Tax=Favolaschia claudopus TaxID=2862362 RepID=A0AAW0EJE0_9AGAR
MSDSKSTPLVQLPARLLSSALSAFFAFLRPYFPHILPLVVCLSLVPLLLLLSASAGWVVWRNAAVGWKAPLYLQYGDGVPPYAQMALPPLVSQQRYDVFLHLQVPNLEGTYALGNFMTTLTLSSRSNKTIASIRRPTIVTPPRVPFYSRAPSVIDVKVPLLTEFTPGARLVIANVEVGRRDNWKAVGSGEGREVSVISASLNGIVVHHGIRGLITRLPLLSALISSIIFLVITSLIVGVCVLPLMLRQAAPPYTEPEPHFAQVDIKPLPTISSSSSEDSEDVEEKPLVPARRSRPSSRTEIKIEDAPSTTLASSGSQTVRRRRSTLADSDLSSDSSES